MCLIVAKLKNVALPKAQYLKNGNESNPQGIGVTYWKDGENEITIKKDFKNISKLLRWLPNNITKKDALIIHFRVASCGVVDKGNRHPFPVTKNWRLLRKTNLKCKMAVAHNGVLPEYNFINQKYSDSQKFVMDILSDNHIKNNLSSRVVRKLIKNFIGNDRLAFLNNRGVITLIGDFEEDKGVLYSNGSFKKYEIGDEEKISLGDDIFLGGRVLGLADSMYKRNWGLVNQGSFSGLCEICLKKKNVKYVYHQETCQNYSLCKGCEKKLENGYFKRKANKGSKLEQCGSCLNWNEKKDLTKYGDLYICPICSKIKDF